MYAFFGDKRTNKQMDSTNALSRNIALKFYSVVDICTGVLSTFYPDSGHGVFYV